ncbi:MAG: hypothetical protein R2867_20785 [Caldilineaceae bacterium]
MTTWQEFAQQAPALANFGKERFGGGVAYLATVRADGGPRVHPVTPIIGEQLSSLWSQPHPKARICSDGRYTLHCAVENSSGGSGEFYVRGIGTLTNDLALRAQAVATASYTPQDRYILFVLSIDFAFMNCYVEGQPTVQRWQEEADRSA